MKYLSSLGICLCLGLGLMSAGCSDSKESSVSFIVQNSGSPGDPKMLIPKDTYKFKMELFREPAVSGKPVVFKDEPYSGAREEAAAKGFGRDDKDEIKHTYYSKEKLYESGEPHITIDDVNSGEWIMRISAVNSAGDVLGYYQEGINVNKGGSADFKGWLRPGNAPEGYIYAADTSGGCLSRVSLYSGFTEKCPLASGNPAYLFSNKEETLFSDSFYASTGGNKILKIIPKITENRADTEEIGFPVNGTWARGGVSAVLSFYKEGMVRFFDYEEKASYDYCYTGDGADYISTPVNSEVWVCNTKDNNISRVGLESKSLINPENTKLGADVPYAAEAEADNEKVWVIGQRNSGGFVRAIKSDVYDGSNWGEFTVDVSNPSALYVDADKYVYITDNTRGEIICLDGRELDSNGNIKEVFGKTGKRLKISGGGDQILADSSRIYILQYEKGQIVSVDLQTMTVSDTYSLGASCRNMMMVK